MVSGVGGGKKCSVEERRGAERERDRQRERERERERETEREREENGQ